MLSNGEFVVNVQAARQNRLLLEAINGNRLLGMDLYRDVGLMTTGAPEFPPVGRPPAPPPAVPGDSGLTLRPIVINLNGVTDFRSFQGNMPHMRGQLRKMLDRAIKRDD